ncbi:MAG TPA: hypothetical protein VM290_02650 [Gaiellaceae bacterium]|nr:hypothetical protein [Gaiellaceae bacterium]
MRWLAAVLVVAALLVAGAAVLVRSGGVSEEATPVRTVTVTGMVTEAGAAVGDAPDPAAEPTLPEAVLETRAALLEAADAGDYDRLAELAGPDFNYSFGGPIEGGPAAFWRAEEERGSQPLAALAAILRLPYGLAGGLYVWPFAHTADPATFTEYERELLERIPGGAPVRPEGYLGWRAGITPDGEWQFFVAGD